MTSETIRTSSSWNVSPNSLVLSSQQLEKTAAYCLDIVRPEEYRCACFTKAYGRYLKGSGSVLKFKDSSQTVESNESALSAKEEQKERQIEEQKEQKEQKEWYKYEEGCLRLFSPREVSALLGFPPVFSMPEYITARQAYALLGNSVHVGVVSILLVCLLQIECQDQEVCLRSLLNVNLE